MSFTLNDIYPVLKKSLPRRNDFYACSYAEEFEELEHFGVDTPEALEALMAKHHDAIMAEDRAEIDENTEQYYFDELGKGVVEERVAAGYWFSYPALLRMALYKEFGQAYLDYTDPQESTEHDIE